MREQGCVDRFQHLILNLRLRPGGRHMSWPRINLAEQRPRCDAPCGYPRDLPGGGLERGWMECCNQN